MREKGGDLVKLSARHGARDKEEGWENTIQWGIAKVGHKRDKQARAVCQHLVGCYGSAHFKAEVSSKGCYMK